MKKQIFVLACSSNDFVRLSRKLSIFFTPCDTEFRPLHHYNQIQGIRELFIIETEGFSFFKSSESRELREYLHYITKQDQDFLHLREEYFG